MAENGSILLAIDKNGLGAGLKRQRGDLAVYSVQGFRENLKVLHYHIQNTYL